MFSDDQIEKLSAKLDGLVVRTREQSGRELSYIEGWHAIAEANRIFGFGEWTSEVESLQCVVNTAQGTHNFRGETGYYIAYLAHVVVTVGDQRHGDYGYGHGIDYGNVGSAHESAAKEAVTDAMKRALRHWGSPFGLALYDKDQREVERTPAGKPAAVDKPAPISQPVPAGKPPVTPEGEYSMVCPMHRGQVDERGKRIDTWFIGGKLKAYKHPNPEGEDWCVMTAVLAAQLGTIVDRGAITNDEISSRITGLYGAGTTFGGLQPQQQLAIVAEVVEATSKGNDKAEEESSLF